MGYDAGVTMTATNTVKSDARSRRKRAIDVHVGSRIRIRRQNIGMSQVDLASALGVRHQQVHFYEVGNNQVTSTALHNMAQVLDVPMSFFFDDMPDTELDPDVLPNASSGDPLDTINIFSVNEIESIKQEMHDILSIYYKIKDRSARKVIVDFLKLLGRQR